MKLRDVCTGSTFDTSYRPEEKFEQAIIETVPAQYLKINDETAYLQITSGARKRTKTSAPSCHGRRYS